MRPIKCEKGHWYDADSYTKCPHCNPSTGKIKTASGSTGIGTIPQKNDDLSSQGISFENERKKQELDSFAESHSPVGSEKQPSDTYSAFQQRGGSGDYAATSSPRKERAVEPSKSTSENDETTDLRKELQGVSNSSVTKTMSYFGRINQTTGQNNSENNVQQPMSAAPVVGWLVCIAGPHIGQSFNITAGKNSIGRGPDNDIILSADPTVSGSKHAWVTFEAKHRNFILQAGDGRYPDLNGQQVIEGKMLKAFDKIELGETMLLFVNLCGDTFAWEEYLNKHSYDT